jgi:hypothetical protein
MVANSALHARNKCQRQAMDLVALASSEASSLRASLSVYCAIPRSTPPLVGGPKAEHRGSGFEEIGIFP